MHLRYSYMKFSLEWPCCVSGSNLEPMVACHEISAIISSSYNTFLLRRVNFNVDNMFLWVLRNSISRQTYREFRDSVHLTITLKSYTTFDKIYVLTFSIRFDTQHIFICDLLLTARGDCLMATNWEVLSLFETRLKYI